MKVFNEKGFTLIELLATFTITIIVIPVIYGVFTSGIKIYDKIQIEGQLRDDADYAVTMLMNTFYAYPFDYVKECAQETNCIELVNDSQTEIRKIEGDTSAFYDIFSKDEDTPTSVKVKFSEVGTSTRKITSVEINGVILDAISDFKDSKTDFTCSKYEDLTKNKCSHGIINMNLKLDHERLKQPLDLNSQFGF